MIKYSEGKCFAGRTLVMSSKKVEIQVTLDVGPRIISLRYLPDGKNIFYEDVNDLINKDVSASYGEGEMWHIYGGTRMWLSPENETTYVPDNDLVKYEKIKNGAIFVPKKWPIHNVQTKMKIEFVDEEKINVEMSATNLSNNILPLCIWSLSVCKSGGMLVVPLSREDTGYLPNRNIVHWPYNDILDGRYAITNEAIFLASNPKNKRALKLGTFLPNIIAQYMYEDTVYIKEVMGDKKGHYPDFSCNFETYTNDLIHEVETLSPISLVKPLDTITHVEKWTVKKAKKSWVENTKKLQLAAPQSPVIYL